jgi:hypothetical protein
VKFALNVPHLPQFINVVLAWQPGVAEVVPSRSGEQLHRHTPVNVFLNDLFI